MSTRHLGEFDAVKREFPYVDWLDTGTNGGGGKARNIGLKHAIGDYVFFADSDDYFLPELNRMLDKYAISDSTPDLIFCRPLSIYDGSDEVSPRASFFEDFFLLQQSNPAKADIQFRYNFGVPWCRFVNRRLIERHNIAFDEISIHNDTRFSYLVGYHARTIEYYTEQVYVTTDRKGSVSKKLDWDNLEIRAHIFAEKMNFLHGNKVKFYDQITFTPLLHALKHRRFDQFRRYMKVYRQHHLSRKQVATGCAKLLGISIAEVFSRLSHRH